MQVCYTRSRPNGVAGLVGASRMPEAGKAALVFRGWQPRESQKSDGKETPVRLFSCLV